MPESLIAQAQGEFTKTFTAKGADQREAVARNS
jgi:hypothetical protein